MYDDDDDDDDDDDQAEDWSIKDCTQVSVAEGTPLGSGSNEEFGMMGSTCRVWLCTEMLCQLLV